MAKSPEAFRTISEVAEWLDTPTHVLRFWESRFTQIKPVKRAGGRRYYRPSDMRLIGGIKHLLHDQGMTIKGVQKLLREKGVRHVSEFSPPIAAEEALEGAVIEAVAAPVPEPEPVEAAAPEPADKPRRAPEAQEAPAFVARKRPSAPVPAPPPVPARPSGPGLLARAAAVRLRTRADAEALLPIVASLRARAERLERAPAA